MAPCTPCLATDSCGAQVWDNVEGGLAEPVRTPVSHEFSHLAGGDADLTSVAALGEQFEERIEREILRPLAQWRAVRQADEAQRWMALAVRVGRTVE